MYKKLYVVGMLSYLLLFILALIFCKERTVFLDIAYHLFYIIKDGDFAIQNFRFGAVFTQIFPLVSSKLSLPLQGIMVMYSLGFIVYYFLCYLICGTILKQYQFALVIMMLNVLFVSDSFYWMQSELPQGLAFTVMMFAWICRKQWSTMGGAELGLMFAGIITAAFFHPLLPIVFLYVCLYILIDKNILSDKKILIATSIFYIIILLVKRIAFKTSYDSNAMGGMSNFLYLFPNYFSIESNKQFFYNCIAKYYWIPILSLGIIFRLLIQKKWKLLILFASFLVGYILLINVSYFHGNAKPFYIENLYLPLAIIIGMPFLYEVLPVLMKKKLAMPVLILIIITGVIRIYVVHQGYSGRLSWFENYLAENKDQKLFVSEKSVPMDTILMSWGSSYEFWLLSTIKFGHSSSILIYENGENVAWMQNANKAFAAKWGLFPYAELDKRYFKFTDTTSFYKVIE